jgi:GNAT superfamily N-acetyltransferase
MTNTWGFVLVSKNELGEEDVVGYTLGATDTRAFEAELEEKWFPTLRERFPLSLTEDYATPNGETTAINLADLTAEDKRYIKLFHKPDTAYDACVAFSPAHLHIDILPEHQRQGWGRKLIDAAVRQLSTEGESADGKKLEGLWLCMDPRNKEAASFYERLGFERVHGAPETCVGLKFEDWLKRYNV